MLWGAIRFDEMIIKTMMRIPEPPKGLSEFQLHTLMMSPICLVHLLVFLWVM